MRLHREAITEVMAPEVAEVAAADVAQLVPTVPAITEATEGLVISRT
jgi:hypothetical protein